MKLRRMNKTGGVVGDLVYGTGALIIGVIVTLLIVSTLLDAGILSGKESATAANLSGNFTTGIGKIGDKIPTILLIAAIVIIFGVIVILVRQSQQMGIGGGRGGSL